MFFRIINGATEVAGFVAASAPTAPPAPIKPDVLSRLRAELPSSPQQRSAGAVPSGDEGGQVSGG